MRLLNALSSICSFIFSSRTPHRYVLVSFLLLYLLLLQYCRLHYYRDPTSSFFNPSKGYEPIYSRFRISQATSFIRHIDATASPRNGTASAGNSSASLCVGIASIARTDASYVEAAVGSLLVDLAPQERDDVHLILFIPHVDPTIHPLFASNWTAALADKILLYDVDSDKLDHLRQLEKEGGLFREKALFDYVYLLKACQDVGTPYVVMVEDDVVAMDGWYHRTKRALEDAERQTRRLGASKYLYLRLFYTQGLLGWNKEEWFTYLVSSATAVAILAAILLITRRYIPCSVRILSNQVIIVLCLICAPLCIILFFASGRLSMLSTPAGVHQMPRFGCCSQALAFPRNRVADVISWYETKRIGFADSLLEEYANANDEIRWALTPSVFQHVGVKSSKQDGPGDDIVAKETWNVDFELNDPIALQIQHEVSAKAMR
ncbi:predicted protein [Uncinocarpus reesii 1704]|uniref:Integral membrane protein n=1 Tax=Uncinocarpus reesii (strain UAMH 1704) TaxID=336963 RepID=C4JX43_UNCRE|nr:uncharacterized protein UREG_06216 [Uncinocarpus reesii 1704]EEP81351.1 predicted protein [Uncinocarpus reesii 1704]